MVPQNSLMSERIAILATIRPQSTASTGGGTITSTAINIAGTNANFFSRMMAIAQFTSTNKVTVSLISGTDSAATLATSVASQTNLSSSSTDTVVIDLNPFTQALSDSTNTYIALRVACTSDGVMQVGGAIIGGDGRNDPASTYNASTVNTTIKSV